MSVTDFLSTADHQLPAAKAAQRFPARRSHRGAPSGGHFRLLAGGAEPNHLAV